MLKSKPIMYLVLALTAVSCNLNKETNMYTKGSYGFDVTFFENQQIETIQLKNDDSDAQILIVPGYQGRVMTSTANGLQGPSFGWINHDYIKAGELNQKFNPFGGEERFWFGPEGGPFSIYFEQGDEQTFENWRVPKELDTVSFEVKDKSESKVSFQKKFALKNASGTNLEVEVNRNIKLLSIAEAEKTIKMPISQKLKWVGYETENILKNTGANNWTEDTGFLSIWMLCMFNPGDNVSIFLPFNQGNNEDLGKIVEDNYFGKVPSERLIVKDDVVYFKADGKHRSKVGLSPQRATPYCGSYDTEKKVLTILWYSKTKTAEKYVNSQWGHQENPLKGDVINSYNDGPVEDGSIMGPFYEIESSSPAALLNSGDSIKHTQQIFHITGDESLLNEITENAFNISLEDIKSIFNK